MFGVDQDPESFSNGLGINGKSSIQFQNTLVVAFMEASSKSVRIVSTLISISFSRATSLNVSNTSSYVDLLLFVIRQYTAEDNSMYCV